MPGGAQKSALPFQTPRRGLRKWGEDAFASAAYGSDRCLGTSYHARLLNVNGARLDAAAHLRFVLY